MSAPHVAASIFHTMVRAQLAVPVILAVGVARPLPEEPQELALPAQVVGADCLRPNNEPPAPIVYEPMDVGGGTRNGLTNVGNTCFLNSALQVILVFN